MRPWHLGNTTVRSPFRLRDGLVALSTSSLQGNLRGRDQEIELRRLLGAHGIVELGEDETYSVGRKWRSALNKLGFLFPEVPPASGILQNDIGPIDMITPNGWRLIRAESVAAMQECFLRALAAFYIPSALERGFVFSVFSPLRHTLSVMLKLEQLTGESTLNFIEMAVIVQLTSGADSLDEIVSQILELRSQRLSAPNKRRFDRERRDSAALQHNYVANTFNDYSDTNFRYLKATGLVQSKGRGISLVPEKHVFIEQLILDTGIPDTDRSYLVTLCNGSTLPTDNKDAALVVLEDLVRQVTQHGVDYSLTGKSVQTAADIEVIRHDIENIFAELKEDEYALRQTAEWEEISEYMNIIINPRHYVRTGDAIISIPQTELPAYFEWVLWRAFLAIDSLRNKPYDARRFKIDQDFLPVCTAPGNGPDLIFEFEEFVVVVEVTLTQSSRQEAAEGEPVRRHVAALVTQYSKPVYGLFIANRIDSNTAETFRIGNWYTRDDIQMSLDIIPLTLSQFKLFFEALFRFQNIDVSVIRELLELCCSNRTGYTAPQWKTEIERIIRVKVESLSTN